jgi:hypothetical protein
LGRDWLRSWQSRPGDIECDRNGEGVELARDRDEAFAVLWADVGSVDDREPALLMRADQLQPDLIAVAAHD